MKKVYFVVLTATTLLLSSCVTSMKTATTMDIHPSVRNVTVADLDVAPERITYRMVPSKAIQRGGIENVKQAAENEALQKNGNADILVEPQFVYSMKNGRVKSIEVTGRPAYYTNFRSLPDTVWSNPYFNGMAPVVAGSGKGVNLGNTLGSLFGGKSSAEKEQKTKKVRNPYRSTGFHAYFEGSLGYMFNGGRPDYFMPEDYDFSCGGWQFTLGAQLDEQFYVGVGVGCQWTHDEDDAYYGYISSEEKALRGLLNSTWTKYSYERIKEPFETVEESSGEFNYFDRNEEQRFIPIYANARYYFSPKKISPFVDMKLGWSIADDSNLAGGFYLAPSIGIGIRRLHIALKYSLQSTGYSGKFKDQMDDFLNAVKSSDNESWERGSYVSYYDGRNNVIDKYTTSEAVMAMEKLNSNTNWFVHYLSLSVGLRF